MLSQGKRHDMGRDAVVNEGPSWNYFMQCFKTSLPSCTSMSPSVYPGPCGWQSSSRDCHSFLFPVYQPHTASIEPDGEEVYGFSSQHGHNRCIAQSVSGAFRGPLCGELFATVRFT